MLRPKLLMRALDDLSAIAAAARAAPRAARRADERADRVERRLKQIADSVAPLSKRLNGVQREIEALDKRVSKLGKRLAPGVEASRRTARAVESVDTGVDAVAASTQGIEPKLRQVHASVHPLAGEIAALRAEVERLTASMQAGAPDGNGGGDVAVARPTD